MQSDMLRPTSVRSLYTQRKRWAYINWPTLTLPTDQQIGRTAFYLHSHAPSATERKPQASGALREVRVYSGDWDALHLYVWPSPTNAPLRPTPVRDVYTLPCISTGTSGYGEVTPRTRTNLPCLRPTSSSYEEDLAPGVFEDLCDWLGWSCRYSLRPTTVRVRHQASSR